MVARDESWPNHVFLFSLDETQRDLKTVIRLDEPVKELAWRPEQGVDSQVLSMTSSLASMTFWFGDGSEGGRTELMQSGGELSHACTNSGC